MPQPHCAMAGKACMEKLSMETVRQEWDQFKNKSPECEKILETTFVACLNRRCTRLLTEEPEQWICFASSFPAMCEFCCWVVVFFLLQTLFLLGEKSSFSHLWKRSMLLWCAKFKVSQHFPFLTSQSRGTHIQGSLSWGRHKQQECLEIMMIRNMETRVHTLANHTQPAPADSRGE